MKCTCSTNAERGPTLEVVLARLMQVNPAMQVLALSATMGNVDEIAAWLKAQFVITEWRPVTLKEGVLLHDEIQFKDGDATKNRAQNQQRRRQPRLKHRENRRTSTGFCFHHAKTQPHWQRKSRNKPATCFRNPRSARWSRKRKNLELQTRKPG